MHKFIVKITVLWSIIWLILTTSQASDSLKAQLTKPIQLTGNTIFTKENRSSTLVTKLAVTYKFTLFEPSHKKWLIFLGGKVSVDYDHFGKNVKENVFTVLGIDF